MNIQTININELNAAEYNPRKKLKAGDSEYEKIKKSIETFGYVDPIIANKDLTIIGGHQRHAVLKDLGFKEVDCVIVDVDKVHEKALNIALNKISGEWDNKKLEELLTELVIVDLANITGFDIAEIEDICGSKEIEEDNFDIDKALEEINEPITKLGDIWILGKHRLLCGDSTDENAVSKLMQDEVADMVFTDPPWNVNYGATDHPSWKSRTIMNDAMPTEDFKEFMNGTFKVMNKFSKAGAIAYVVMSAQEWGNMMLTLKDNEYHWSSTIIWNKDSLVLSRKDYHTKYEPLWYGWKEGQARLHPLDDRKQCDVWDIPRPKVSELHPTMKPVELVVRAVKNSSDIKNIILDLFGGSGTTLIACDGTDRYCRMMELDPKYCDVIMKRYIELKGSNDDVFLIRDGEKSKHIEIENEK